MQEPQYLTTKDMHRALIARLRGRPDMGFGNAASDLALEARNPFEPGARRRPKPVVVVVGSLVIIGLAWFVYFNFRA